MCRENSIGLVDYYLSNSQRWISGGLMVVDETMPGLKGSHVDPDVYLTNRYFSISQVQLG